VPVVLSPLVTVISLVTVVAVVGLVAWALQLMEAANARSEFSLMLAGCMVCSAAVGLATVMVITLTSPERFSAAGVARGEADAGISLDAVALPFDDPLECLVDVRFCASLPSS
jgi:ABC-type glycerol-3-phosphate transport system permease component